MEYFLAAIVGWCGTWWPRRWPGGGGGGGGSPDDPWPPNCWVCGPLVGAIAGVVIYVALRDQFGTDMGSIVVLSFFGGAFGSSLVGGVVGMMKGGK